MTNEIIIYQTEDGQTQIDVRMENETVWLSASQMASLFDREESNIRRHIINVFNEGELERTNNVQNLHVNGVKKPVPFYTLDVIISVRLSCEEPARRTIPPMGQPRTEAISRKGYDSQKGMFECHPFRKNIVKPSVNR